MKGFVRKLLILLLVVFLGDQLIGKYMDHLYEKNYMHYANGHLNYYIQKNTCDTLLLGSSRVLDNMNPEVFGPKTFNISQAQKHIGWFAAIVHLLETKHKLPRKLLVLHLEPEDFDTNNPIDLNADIHYLKPYYNQDYFIQKEICKRSIFESIKYASSCFRYNGEGFLLLTNPMQNIGFLPIHRGFVPIAPTPDDSARIESTATYFPKNKAINCSDQDAIYYFETLHQICKRNKIQLIVVTTPYFHTDPYFHKVAACFSTYLEKKNIPYINHLKLSEEWLKVRKYWFDNMHFNSLGAKKYSDLLKNEILSIK
jgi:hypothetical protein